MMIEFDYKREHLRTGEIVFRPVAKIYIREIEGEWIAEYFYVDSGADFTLIPYQMGRFIGLGEVASEFKEIGGIGGVIGIRLATIPMRIGKYQFDCTIAWAQIERVPFLLGRKDVFEHFEITFRQKKKKIIFKWIG